MRKFSLFLALVCAMICVSTASAQYLINQTRYTPSNFRSSSVPVSLNFGNGYRFEGVKNTTTNNGQIISVSYTGSAIFPDGGRIITAKAGYAFDANCQPTNGLFWEIEPSGEVYCVERKNGQDIRRTRVNRKYVIEDNCIVFPKTAKELQAEAAAAAAAAGAYSGGTGTSSSSSGSSNSRHSATCRGCNGSGRCQHCGGSGWVNNHRSKCSLCHGTGRCQPCAGVGKIYGL